MIRSALKRAIPAAVRSGLRARITEARRRRALNRQARDYHEFHENEADAVYLSIVAQSPDRTLQPHQERQIEEYSRDTFGSLDFTPWLRVYTAWRGSFAEGWMPDNYFGYHVLPAIQGRFRGFANYRALQHRLFGPEFFPDLLCCNNGRWFTPDGNTTLGNDEVTQYLFADHPFVYVKTDSSSRGRGVRRLARADFDPTAVADRGDCVVQSAVRQAAFFDAFMPDSVATLRITTVCTLRRAPHLRAAFLRFGRTGDPSIVADDSIRVPVVDAQGRLSEDGSTGDWKRVREHPDTGTPFSGHSIPHFAAAVQVCETLHARMSQMGVIGWDVAIDDVGQPRIMEWNSEHPGINFTEASIGPSFRGLGWDDILKNSIAAKQ